MTRMTHSLALLAVLVGLTVPTHAAAPPQRSYAAGNFGLELDGVFVGFVSNVEGGNLFSNVIKELNGEEYFVKKHLDAPGSRDIAFEFAGGMDPALYNWIKGALQRQYLPKNGAVLMFDYKYALRTRLDFERAQITQVTFPELDATSKEPMRFSIRITPAFTTLIRNPAGSVPSIKQAAQKQLLTSMFRLNIDGLDMSRTTNVDALTVNLPLLVDPASVCVKCDPVPTAPIDFPNVVATISAASADSIYAWLDDFLIQGDNSDESEKSGSLDYLSASSQTVFQLLFKGLGIFEVAPVPASNTDAIAKVVVSMYCERIDFNAF